MLSIRLKLTVVLANLRSVFRSHGCISFVSEETAAHTFSLTTTTKIKKNIFFFLAKWSSHNQSEKHGFDIFIHDTVMYICAYTSAQMNKCTDINCWKGLLISCGHKYRNRSMQINRKETMIKKRLLF